MRSFSLLRTNVGLTTNIKIVVDSNYGLYLESINSTNKLESTKFKKVQFNKNNYFDELLPYFFKDFPSDEAFKIYNSETDSHTMNSDFSTQFDSLYVAGARNISNNKNYTEEFEYFAPLYIFKNQLPKYFIIFRVDGPGILDLNADNFKSEFLEKFKTIKIFDLTRKTVLGEWIENNFVLNKSFPDTGLYIDFRNLEFSKWYGISYKKGGYTSKSRFLENYFENERPLYDLEKYIFDGYAETQIIYPHILNFSFLFDDTPATPLGLRKWSINRYSGFFLDDLEIIDIIHNYDLIELKNDVTILENNILYSASGTPFVNEMINTSNLLIEINGKFYKIEEFEEVTTNTLTSNTSTNRSRNVRQNFRNSSRVGQVVNDVISSVIVKKYRIIADISLLGQQDLINKKKFYIDSQNQILKSLDNSPLELSDWDKADVHIIEIDGMYHNIIKEDGIIKLNTDYSFDFSLKSKFSYWINNKDPKFYKEVNLNLNIQSMSGFKIYRLKFTDIKDFDNQIVDNEFSRYEYETKRLNDFSGEPKMYITDFRTTNYPNSFEQFKIKKSTPEGRLVNNDEVYRLSRFSNSNTTRELREQLQSSFTVVNLPCSSDYTANLETFRLDSENLTTLWSKNPQHVRFGYQKSISKSNVAYLLNNNSVHEPFNRNSDLFEPNPRRNLRNLDYFYSINSGQVNYLYHSLHIEKNDFYTYSVGTNSIQTRFLQDKTFRFELDKYLNTQPYGNGTYSYDYFSYFFEIPNYYNTGLLKTNIRRYSYFERSDGSISNITLFNGFRVNLYEVDNIILDSEGSVDNVNLKTSNKFENYKFSILLSKNLKYVDNNSSVKDVVDWGTFSQYQTDSGNKIAFKTSDTATPSNISSGDEVYISFKPPYDKSSTAFSPGDPTVVSTSSGANIPFFPGWRTVDSVGQLSGGGYGFKITSTSSQSFTQSANGMWEVNFKWRKIFEWDARIYFQSGDIVIFDGILYRVLQNTKNLSKTEINKEPWELPTFYVNYEFKTPFWKPVEYSQGEWCYREGDYYYRNSNSSGIDFWKPDVVYNNTDQVVIKGGRYFRNTKTLNQSKIPTLPNRRSDISEVVGKDWTEVEGVANSKWNKVPIWEENTNYIQNQYVVHKKILYQAISTPETGTEPNTTSNWSRIYGFTPETDIIYSPTLNPIVIFSGDYYLCENNPGFTLDNGITIYINEKWKNVLVNIAVNDNSSDYLQDVKRDLLYSDLNTRLTAANFIKQINNLDSKYGFIDYLSYVIIKEDGSIKKYSFGNGIENVPYIINIDYPDEFDIKSDQIVYSPISENVKEIRPSKVLTNGEIESTQQLDYYSGIPTAYRIGTPQSRKQKLTINSVGGSKNNIKSSQVAKVVSKSQNLIDVDTIYRHSGYYMPIFYEIELFKSSDEFDISGNYIFDTSLSLFGVMKQRIVSKRSRRGNLLKLKTVEGTKSVYPMLDEFGLTYLDHFIFKSSWDTSYHLECGFSRVQTSAVAINPKINSNILVRSIDQKSSD